MSKIIKIVNINYKYRSVSNIKLAVGTEFISEHAASDA